MRDEREMEELMSERRRLRARAAKLLTVCCDVRHILLPRLAGLRAKGGPHLGSLLLQKWITAGLEMREMRDLVDDTLKDVLDP
jgi:hypothetical protein